MEISKGKAIRMEGQSSRYKGPEEGEAAGRPVWLAWSELGGEWEREGGGIGSSGHWEDFVTRAKGLVGRGNRGPLGHSGPGAVLGVPCPQEVSDPFIWFTGKQAEAPVHAVRSCESRWGWYQIQQLING